jgi:hypothetical protein
VPLAAVSAAPKTLDYTAIAAVQRSCPSMQGGRESSQQLQLVPFGPIGVLYNTSKWHPQPVIPLEHSHRVFNAFHGLAHNGTRATKRQMTEE